ncbi:Hypothetical protein SMAX5B_018707 [Scophthalmus maximus]|uniref:Uncharacterized protein n=1 Tax=Scophthalmus maximus TaxID=52904 RepID=A0A2U9B3B9_SCOMX|nr:Hypothetical protein SMAX5B_018707 [Scophthalmus maximus]
METPGGRLRHRRICSTQTKWKQSEERPVSAAFERRGHDWSSQVADTVAAGPGPTMTLSRGGRSRVGRVWNDDESKALRSASYRSPTADCVKTDVVRKCVE